MRLLHQFRRGYGFFPLPAILRGSGGSFRSQLERVIARERWKSPATLSSRARLCAMWVAWPVSSLVSAVLATSKFGRHHGGQGHSKVSLCLSQWRLACTSHVPPPNYFLFELFRPELAGQAGDFIHEPEMMVMTTVLNRGRDMSLTSDKLTFTRFCRAHNLPVIPVAAIFEHGVKQEVDGLDRSLAARGLFAKPRDLSGGVGAIAWSPAASTNSTDAFIDAEGRTVSIDDIDTELAERSRSHVYLLQPRIVNHEAFAQWTSGGLCTVRILTSAMGGRAPMVRLAAFKMPVGGSIVDNFAGGGLVAPVDPQSGAMSSAARKNPVLPRLDHHPDSGAAVAGAVVPFWSELKELVMRAHGAMPAYPLIGWDVAMTPEGPLLVEANLRPCFDLLQRAHRRPLGREIFGEICQTSLSD